MQRIAAESPKAKLAYQLVESLQQRLVQAMQAQSHQHGLGRNFTPIEWFRADGQHGGGMRFVAEDQSVFNRASVNVSQVQYDTDASKSLASATALSSIIHPHNPYAPSVHLHVSWTEMKSGHGYWRVMADLNPAIENSSHTQQFKSALSSAAGSGLSSEMTEAAFAQGDRYFNIPALSRHRGVCHFYLENFFSDDVAADQQLAETIITAVIDCYAAILDDALKTAAVPDATAFRQQLDYHSLYFFQVLTLDRGTTSGLLVHDQNDVGILGSLPEAVDKALIRSWREKMPEPQGELLDGLLASLAEPSATRVDRSEVTDTAKKSLASAVRQHYQSNPDALSLQASGEIIPPTVSNHR